MDLLRTSRGLRVRTHPVFDAAIAVALLMLVTMVVAVIVALLRGLGVDVSLDLRPHGGRDLLDLDWLRIVFALVLGMTG